MKTSKQVRQEIAGLSKETVLHAEQGTKSLYRLLHQVTYKGWFDEAFAVNSFMVYADKDCLGSYTTLQEALEKWDTLWIFELLTP